MAKPPALRKAVGIIAGAAEDAIIAQGLAVSAAVQNEATAFCHGANGEEPNGEADKWDNAGAANHGLANIDQGIIDGCCQALPEVIQGLQSFMLMTHAACVAWV